MNDVCFWGVGVDGYYMQYKYTGEAHWNKNKHHFDHSLRHRAIL